MIFTIALETIILSLLFTVFGVAVDAEKKIENNEISSIRDHASSLNGLSWTILVIFVLLMLVYIRTQKNYFIIVPEQISLGLLFGCGMTISTMFIYDQGDITNETINKNQ